MNLQAYFSRLALGEDTRQFKAEPLISKVIVITNIIADTLMSILICGWLRFPDAVKFVQGADL